MAVLPRSTAVSEWISQATTTQRLKGRLKRPRRGRFFSRGHRTPRMPVPERLYRETHLLLLENWGKYGRKHGGGMEEGASQTGDLGAPDGAVCDSLLARRQIQ